MATIKQNACFLNVGYFSVFLYKTAMKCIKIVLLYRFLHKDKQFLLHKTKLKLFLLFFSVFVY